MRRAAALLVLLCLGTAAAESPADVPVLPAAPPPEGLVLREGVVTLEEDGTQVRVQEGCWLSSRACLESAKRLAAAEAEREVLRQEDASLSSLALAFALGLAAGAAGVALLSR